MSTYRTISATDLKTVDNLKITLRSSDFLQNEGFYFIKDNYPNTTTVTDTSSHSLISREPSPESDAPSILELQSEMPVLFKYRQTLGQLFLIEEFLASSLMNLGENFVNTEFNFSKKLILYPTSFSLFEKVGDEMQKTLIGLLSQIKGEFELLKKMILKFNTKLLEEYDKIKSNLRLTILSNFRVIKKFENSRVMFTSLKEIKGFMARMTNDELGNSLNNLINNIIDLLYDYNHQIEESQSILSNGPINLIDSSRKITFTCSSNISSVNNFTKLNELVYYIESNLNQSSNFIRDHCSIFSNLVEEIKLGFEEYISNYRKFKFNSLDDKFTYEIVSFDDHLKSQINQNDN